MYLVDSNVFLHDLLHTSESEVARLFLDNYKEKIHTSVYNIMEISSVLSRKYSWKREEIVDVIETLKNCASINVPDEYDSLRAYEIAIEHFLTPIDALLIAISEREGLTLVTYDKGILNLNAIYCPIITPTSV